MPKNPFSRLEKYLAATCKKELNPIPTHYAVIKEHKLNERKAKKTPTKTHKQQPAENNANTQATATDNQTESRATVPTVNAEVSPEAAAAAKIQAVFRARQHQQRLFSNPYATQLEGSDEQTRFLNELMFGVTVAAHKKGGKTPSFIPHNPNMPSSALYYRTDAVKQYEDNIKQLVAEYVTEPDFNKYNYIPITLMTAVNSEELIKKYAARYKGQIQILKKDDSSLAFVRIIKNDEKNFFIKKILNRLGLLPPIFTGVVASLGIKSSPWMIASTKNRVLPKSHSGNGHETTQQHPLKAQPITSVAQLKQTEAIQKLNKIASSPNNPTYLLASCMVQLINRIPENTNISGNTLNRLDTLLTLAANIHTRDYERFSFLLYCIVHEISMLIDQKNIKVSFEEFKKDAIKHALNTLGIAEPGENSNYQFVAVPTNSGTNAMMIALDLVRQSKANKKTKFDVISEMYYEFKDLKLKKFFVPGASQDVYLMTSGATVWSKIYPGSDINKLLRKITHNGKTAPKKPTIIVVDATSGLYRSLKIDPDLKKFIEDGHISILVHESHQKFGLLHTDQAQYGRMYGICSKKHFNPQVLHNFEAKAKKDLDSLIDLQIGAYISTSTGPTLETIKARHFRNARILRHMYRALDIPQVSIDSDKYSLKDKDRGLFVYGALRSKFAKAVAKVFEFRSSFGHFNSTWSDCGPFYRIAASASDTTDILIEGAELYLVASCKRQTLANRLNTVADNYLLKNGENGPVNKMPLQEQIMLAGLIKALMVKKYIPRTHEDMAKWHGLLKYFCDHCDQLYGRKCFHDIHDFYQPIQKFYAIFDYQLLEKGKVVSSADKLVFLLRTEKTELAYLKHLSPKEKYDTLRLLNGHRDKLYDSVGKERVDQSISRFEKAVVNDFKHAYKKSSVLPLFSNRFRSAVGKQLMSSKAPTLDKMVKDMSEHPSDPAYRVFNKTFKS